MLSNFTRGNLLIFLLSFLILESNAQKGYKWDFGAIAGMSNYLGEIGGREKQARPWILDLKLAKTRWDGGGYVRYKFQRMLSAKLAVHYLRIAGEDRLSINAPRRYRNLSFRNDIFDIESTINWHFYTSDKPMGIYMRTRVYFTSYLFVGIGGFTHNPKTFYQGSWVPLQPVRTEDVRYSRFGYCVPFGAGFYVTLSKKRKMHRIGLEVNWRYTNTDYLDDISTTYKNPAELDNHLAVALSNRNDELLKQPDGYERNYGWHGYRADGKTPVNAAPRGDPGDKDSYISVNITYGMSIRGKFTKSRGRKIRSVRF
jgi:hypothetical protein